MFTPTDVAFSVLKTDIQLGDKRDPDDPNVYNLDLTERFLQDDREKNFLDNFKEATEEQNMYQNYYDDDSEFAGYYDDMTRTQEEMRQEAMDRLDDEDRRSAGRVIDRIKDRDINNAIVAAHLGQSPKQTKEALEDMRQQMAPDPREHVMNVRPALFNTKEGFYGPQSGGPRSKISALPLGLDTKLASLDTPIDAAFSVLKPEEEVRKILPALMLGYGAYRGIKNVRDNKVTNPITGRELAEGDDSLGSTALQLGTGFAEGALPLGSLKLGGKVGAKVLARRRAGKYAAAQKEAAEASARHARMSAQQQQAALQSQNPGIVFGQTVQPLPPSQVGAARTAMDQAKSRVARYAPKAPKAPKQGSMVTPLAIGGGIAYAGQQIADALGNMSMGGSGTAAPSGSGMGGGQQQQQGQFSLAGDPSAGNQNLQNVGVGQTGREQIWQQGGSGTFKGETMTFTHYDGNIMLRKTLEDLDKMHCATAKADCPKCGKDCKCDEKKKADDKKGKKPAHGMVIVIGSKNAGPGPSTDGKRDSKD